MKFTLLLLLTFLSISFCFAQQTGKPDDGILMDYYQSQRYLDALDYLKKTYTEPVTNIKALSRLAYTAQMANMLPAAESYYQRIYEVDTTNMGALFSMATINLKRGNEQKAEIFFKRIALKDTTNMAVYAKLATIAEGRKDTVAAVNYLQKANRLNLFDVNVAVDLANFYIVQKHFDQALMVLNKAAESDPDNIYIVQKLAVLTYKNKKWQECIAYCNRLIILDATDPEMFYEMGVSYYNLKNYGCGAEVLTGIPGMYQNEYSDYYASLCYKGLKDNTQVINWLNAAIVQGISGNIASYYGEIADVNEKMNRPKKAVAAYQKGLQFKDDPSIYTALADLYANSLKDKATAAKYYKMATAAFQKTLQYNSSPMAIYTLANLYDAQLKDTASAIKYYKKYLDSKPPEKQQTFVTYSKSRIDQLQTKTLALH